MSQIMNVEIIKRARNIKMQKLESELKDYIMGCQVGERVQCPFCNYSSKKNPTSARIFRDGVLKCFSCGIWRKI